MVGICTCSLVLTIYKVMNDKWSNMLPWFAAHPAYNTACITSCVLLNSNNILSLVTVSLPTICVITMMSMSENVVFLKRTCYVTPVNWQTCLNLAWLWKMGSLNFNSRWWCVEIFISHSVCCKQVDNAQVLFFHWVHLDFRKGMIN